MTSARIARIREKTLARHYDKYRDAGVVAPPLEFGEDVSWERESALCFKLACSLERPAIDEDDEILFTRTVVRPPLPPRNEAYAKRADRRPLHESGYVSNICADWGMALSRGMLGQRERAVAALGSEADPPSRDFLESAVICIDAVLDLADRYRIAAERAGKIEAARVLARVPANPASSFREALQALRLLHSAVWLSGSYHVGLGRFDQYMWPYLARDLESGALSEAEAFDLLCEFFLSLNRDSPLYPGIQQGDNGQSLMLGGPGRDGGRGANLLTFLCLRASNEMMTIDPKINLRVTVDSDRELLREAALLTKNGLGFPQYSNDPVVIEGLTKIGYAPEDAAEYTVAACWEFIVPGKGMDIVNIGAVSFPAAVDGAMRRVAASSGTGDGFEAILEATGEEIERQARELAARKHGILLFPAPWYSVLMTDRIESGRDISEGALYNNCGIHGAGSSNAVDSLRSIQKLVYENRELSLAELRDIIDADWADREDLRRRIADDPEKAGNNIAEVDSLLSFLFDRFADACARLGGNGRGGRFRPGSGSAMYYSWLVRPREGMIEPGVGAGPDGRKKGAFLSSSLAPSQGTRIRGPISVLRSFSAIDYSRICNGGPITLELARTVFKYDSGIDKTIELIRAFCELGCQQLQLNTLDPKALLEAKRDPASYRHLIVRVWGWSAYFCELSEEYQDQIIARHVFV